MFVVQVVLKICGPFGKEEAIHTIAPFHTMKEAEDLIEEIRPWFVGAEPNVKYLFLIFNAMTPLEASRKFD